MAYNFENWERPTHQPVRASTVD